MGKKSVFRTTIAMVMCVSLLLPAVPIGAVSESKTLGQYDSIPGLSGEVLYDTEGRKIDANGGEIHQVVENGKTKWYWFGEDFSVWEEGAARSLHLYSSTDLYNWTREEDLFKGMTSKTQFDTDPYFRNLYGNLSASEKDTVFECLSNCPTAHPRVLYNEKSRQYVMWVPYYGENGSGKQCIATSSSIKGPFKFVKYCDSFGGFTALYKESDGTAYILYQGENGLSISKLTDDYMDVTGAAWKVNFRDGELTRPEVGIFKRDGRYYMVDAGVVWDWDYENQEQYVVPEMSEQYAVADSLTGPWTVHKLQMYDEEKQTFVDGPGDLNPTHQILQVNTEEGTVYINITERWTDDPDKESYVWLPIMFSGDGTMALKKASNWKLDSIGSEYPDIPDEPGDYDSIPGLSGRALYDTEGQRVKANGGEIHQVVENGKTKWYWFGEEFFYSYAEEQNATPGLHLYSSTDLYNWTREEDLFRGMVSETQFDTDPYFKNLYGNLSASEKATVFECLSNCPTAHPRVLYNEKSQQYVMWVPYYDENGSAKQCIATSSSIKGPFKFVKYCENFGGFTALYKESDGTAYILYQGGTELFISKLTDDYMDVTGVAQKVNFRNGELTRPEIGIFKHDGRYYMVDAGVTWEWDYEDQKQYVVVPEQYAVADSLTGPWTVHRLQMYDEEKQALENGPGDLNPTHQILQVNTESGLIYINITERWTDDVDKESYVWLPIKFFEDGTIALRKLSDWRLDMGNPGVENPPVETPSVEVTEVRLTETSKTMKVGEKYRISATVLPTNATNKDLSYSSSDESVVSVSSTGQIEAKKTGKATVTVTSANGKTAELKVTVKAVEDSSVQVTEVRLAETHKTMKVGEKYRVSATVLPADATNKFLSYSSSDDSVASVSNTGQIEAKEAGTATVTVTSANGKTAELKVTVENPPVQVTEVRLTETSKTMKVGEKYLMGATVLPENADNKALSYESSDEAVASVSDTGQIEAKKAGKATVTVTSANGKKAKLKVTVENLPVEVTEVRLTETSKTMKVGEEYLISATVLPENADDKTLLYESSDESVASVSDTGQIEAKKAGTATVTVISVNGKTAELKITVIEEPEPEKEIAVKKVLVSTDKMTVGVGEKVQLEAAVYPANASDQNLTYKPSNNKVKVSKTGKITAQKTGTCKITITSSNNKKAVVKVTVKKKPGKISLNPKKKKLKVGKKFQIKVKLPNGTASYKITYTSNKKSVATVSQDGKVTAKKKGDAVITVKTYNGKKASLKIHVK